MVLAYSLVLLFLAALLVKVDVTSDSEGEQDLFGIFLVAILVAGPVVISLQLASGRILIALQTLRALVFCKKEEPPEEPHAEHGEFEMGSQLQADVSTDGPDESRLEASLEVEDASKEVTEALSNMSIESLFKVLNKDMSGSLSRNEMIGAAYTGELHGMTPEQASKLFNTLDTDKSGSLTLIEFKESSRSDSMADTLFGSASSVTSGLEITIAPPKSSQSKRKKRKSPKQQNLRGGTSFTTL